MLCKQDVVEWIPSWLHQTGLEFSFFPASDWTRVPYGAVAKPADFGAGD